MKKSGHKEFATDLRRACPVCGTRGGKILFYGYDQRFGYRDRFPVKLCPGCGTEYLPEVVKLSQIGKLYEKYYPETTPPHGGRAWMKWLRDRGLTRSLDRLRLWLGGITELWPHMRPGMSVLDVGCGFAWNYFRGGRGVDYLGIEPNAKECRWLKAHGVACFNGLFEDYAASQPRRFDLILLSWVIEHVEKPADFLKQVSALLKPGGRLVVSSNHAASGLKERYGFNSVDYHLPFHLQLFTRPNFEKVVKDAGLKLVSWKLRSEVLREWWQRGFKPVPPGQINPALDSSPQGLDWVRCWWRSRLDTWTGKGSDFEAVLAREEVCLRST